MANHKLPEPTQPEAAYGDEWVIQAIQQSDWLTPEYIAQVKKSLLEPIRTGERVNSTYANTYLAGFLAIDAETHTGVFDKAYDYIRKRIVYQDGNMIPLYQSPLYDDEIAPVVFKLDVSPDS